ncbi:MAG: type 1 glutamine amidotransferase [Acidobacteriota bacterium]
MVEVAAAPVATSEGPPLSQRPLRVVLVQIRGLLEAKRHEIWCIRQCTGLEQEQLYTWNVVDRPEIRWSELQGADAILIGGSGDHSVTRDYPFMPWLTEVVQNATALGKPLFGICWGHHMLARSLGGKVETDPTSGEVGTFRVELTETGLKDPLFDGLPRAFDANLVHHDCVTELPPGFVELARNATCRNQAIRLAGQPIYGTQFHGEMTPSQLRRRLLMYREAYIESEEEAEAVVDQLRPTDEAHGLLRRFLELYT